MVLFFLLLLLVLWIIYEQCQTADISTWYYMMNTNNKLVIEQNPLIMIYKKNYAYFNILILNILVLAPITWQYFGENHIIFSVYICIYILLIYIYMPNLPLIAFPYIYICKLNMLKNYNFNFCWQCTFLLMLSFQNLILFLSVLGYFFNTWTFGLWKFVYWIIKPTSLGSLILLNVFKCCH